MPEKNPYVISGLFLAVVLFTGCTTLVPLNTQVHPRPQGERIQRAVELVAPAPLRNRVDDKNGFFWIGVVNHWKFEIGSEVVDSSKTIYRLFFDEVDEVERKGLNEQKYFLVIEPSIERFEISTFALETNITLKYRVTRSSGELVLENVVHGSSSHLGLPWSTFFLGIFAGQSALSESVSEALNVAYANLVKDLEDAVKRNVFDASMEPVSKDASSQPQ